MPQSKRQKVFRGVVFSGQHVFIDDKRFEGCEFRNCTLEFGATAEPVLDGCGFIDCQWQFTQHAGLTVTFIQLMAQVPGMEETVDAIIDHLRKPPPAGTGSEGHPSMDA